MTRTRIHLTVCLALAAAAGIAATGPLPANIAAAAADPARRTQAKDDATRHGPELLAFAGVRPGARVVDLIPGGGYWTRLLSGAVGPRGRVYGVWPTQYLKVDGQDAPPYRALAQEPTYANVRALDQDAVALTVPEPVDLVFTAQNYHDYADRFMAPATTATLNRAAFAALKPGGTYVVIDHVADAGSGHRDTETLHRIDPAAVKAEVAAAGFRFVAASPLLANPADDHRRKVFDPAIRGNTDQFVFKFRKP